MIFLRKKSAAAFTPASLSNLLFWHDGSLSSKTYHSGSIVSQWNDLSGNARHWTNSTSGDSPVDNTRTINGITALDFAGSEAMQMGSGHGISTVGHLFFVGIIDTYQSSDKLLAAGAQTDTDDGFSLQQSSSTNQLALLLSDGTAPRDILHSGAGNTFTPGTAYLIQGRFSGSGTYAIKIGTNTTSSTASNGGCTGPDNFFLMANDISGNTAGTDGCVAAVVGYSDIKSGTDLSNLESYFAARFGV